MAQKKQTDVFANVATINCTESAPNTLTYKKLDTGIAMFEKVAWILHRVEYFVHNLGPDLLDVPGALTNIALTASDTLTTLGNGNIEISNQVLHGIQWKLAAFNAIGAATQWDYQQMPTVFDFSSLPGGGIIVPPTTIFLAVESAAAALEAIVYTRIFYTIMELKPEDYWELVEARRFISS